MDFVDQNVGWGTLHDILHVAKKETLRRGHLITSYTTSKYYGPTRTLDNIVPRGLRALRTKTGALLGQIDDCGRNSNFGWDFCFETHQEQSEESSQRK